MDRLRLTDRLMITEEHMEVDEDEDPQITLEGLSINFLEYLHELDVMINLEEASLFF